MKKTYNIPAIRVSRFMSENVIKASGLANTAANAITQSNGGLKLDNQNSVSSSNTIVIDWKTSI